MKILSFGHIPSWAGGRQNSGLANAIYQLAKGMSDCEGAEVALAATDVAVPLIQDGKLAIMGWTRPSLVRYMICNPARSLRWLRAVVRARRLYGPSISVPHFFVKGMHLSRCLRRVKPDVVHLHGLWACIYDSLVPDSAKVVVTMHGLIGTDEMIAGYRHLMKMERDVCRSKRYSFVAFVAGQLIGEFAELYGPIESKALAIPNAYDSKAFHYIEPEKHDKLTLATIASLSDRKGQNRVIEAIARAGVDCRYVCIGCGDAEQTARNEELAKRLGVDYEFVGRKSPAEIRQAMAQADYMILPSSTEGFGLVFLEAIACGVPVVLPKCLPIVNEKGLIKPGENAVLIADSSAEAIAAALPSLGMHDFDRRKVAETIPGYTWAGVAQRYVDAMG